MKNNILKSIFALTILAVSFTACKKEQENSAPLLAQNKKATTPTNSSFIGPNYVTPPGTPPNFNEWGNVYFDFATNTSGTTSASPRLRFAQHFTSTIFTGNGIQLYYKDIASTTLSAITVSDFTGATSVSVKLGSNTSSVGWYQYIGQNAYPVDDRYIFAEVTGSTDLYVLQLDVVVPFQNPLNAAQYKANPVSFNWVKIR